MKMWAWVVIILLAYVVGVLYPGPGKMITGKLGL